jgi:hypothetical protein
MILEFEVLTVPSVCSVVDAGSCNGARATVRHAAQRTALAMADKDEQGSKR